MKAAVQLDPVLNQNAYALLVPEGWKFQGEIVWAGPTPNPWPHLSVANPALHAAWRLFPRMFYVADLNNPNYPPGSTLPATGFEVEPLPASAQQFLKERLIRKYIPEVDKATDVRLISKTDMPEVADAIAKSDPLHRTINVTRVAHRLHRAGGAGGS